MTTLAYQGYTLDFEPRGRLLSSALDSSERAVVHSIESSFCACDAMQEKNPSR